MRALLPVLLVATLWACGSTEPSVGRAPTVRRVPAPQVHSRTPPSFAGTLAERCRELEPLMREAAVRHGVDVGLIAGIIRVESSFRPAVRSGAGAVGLMQVMPSNAKRLSCGNLTKPRHNIDCGLVVLKRFLAHYDHDLMLALSGYNSGHRRPNAARRDSTTPSNLSYVEKVLAARAAYLRHGCRR